VEMGDPKLLDKLRQFCEAYKTEYAFEGVVEGFDTVEAVDPKRLNRGMFVRTENGTRLVHFNLKKWPLFEIGNSVIVVGRNGWRGENSVLPAVIVNSKGHYALFSGDIGPKSKRSAILCYIPMYVGIGFWMTAIRFLPEENFWIYSFVGLLLMYTSCLAPYFMEYLRRPRLLHCDEQSWHELTTEIVEKFGIKLAAQL
jgi:hypothetical protein